MICGVKFRILALLALSCLFVAQPTLAKNKKSQCKGMEAKTERLFLQQLSDSSVIVKWRGEADTLCFGRKQNRLKTLVQATHTEGNHKEAIIKGLKPKKTYYYSVGGARFAPEGQQFTTSPKVGKLPKDKNTRIWILGDSGANTDEDPTHGGHGAVSGADAVRDGAMRYIAENGGEPIDMLLMLGDNAYLNGSDFNYQQGMFDLYTNLLKKVSAWSTIGNHEMGAIVDWNLCETLLIGRDGNPIYPCDVMPLIKDDKSGVSMSSDPNSWRSEGTSHETSRMPYLDIFSFPTAGELGGVPSGTEQYYSFDQANIHVAVLDSQLSARDETQLEAMAEWLKADLSANKQDWTIVIFHHPPYSKGNNHDSDITEFNLVDRPMWDMRNQFVPIFEEYGVDVVYSGHAHSYERSHYISGHTGYSETYSHAEHAELVGGDPERPASGKGEESYAQLSPTSGHIDNRVVYTVNGSSGMADRSSSTVPDWLQHPAHIIQEADTATPKRRGLPRLGSVLMDVDKKSLTARFVNIDGKVLDSFTITR